MLLPGKFHGQRNLVSYSPWDCKESQMTEQLHLTTHGEGRGGGDPGSVEKNLHQPVKIQTLPSCGNLVKYNHPLNIYLLRASLVAVYCHPVYLTYMQSTS